MTKPSVTAFMSFQVVIRTSPDTNDHQVRFFADGLDLIETFCSGSIGLDPDDVLLASTLAPNTPPKLTLVARCDCGVTGCGDIEATITQVGESVSWQLDSYLGNDLVLQFPAEAYLREIERAAIDTSWETPDRTAARLFREAADHKLLASRNLRVLWASGRVRQGLFTVSLELTPGPYQILVHALWSDQSPAEMAAAMAKMVVSPPESWPEVQYFPQVPGLPKPKIAGPRWRSTT